MLIAASWLNGDVAPTVVLGVGAGLSVFSGLVVVLGYRKIRREMAQLRALAEKAKAYRNAGRDADRSAKGLKAWCRKLSRAAAKRIQADAQALQAGIDSSVETCRETDRLTGTLTRTVGDANEARQRLAEVLDRVEARLAEIAPIMREPYTLRDEVSQLSGRLAELMERARQASGDLTAVIDRADSERETIAEFPAQCADALERAAQAKNGLAELVERVSAVATVGRDVQDRLEGRVESSKELIESMEPACAMASEAAEKLTGTIAETNEQMAWMRTVAEQIRRDVEGPQRCLSAIDGELKRLDEARAAAERLTISLNGIAQQSMEERLAATRVQRELMRRHRHRQPLDLEDESDAPTPIRVAALAKSTADAPSFDLPDLADDERAELIERSLQLPPRHQQPTNVFEMVAAG